MSSPQPTMRLTVAQAIIKYLAVQYSEFDSARQRLIPAMYGIFGHGNVSGIGQALDEFGEHLPYLQGRNEQAMVHTAIGFAKAKRRRSTLAVTASIGPGSTNMLTGAATATINRIPVLLLPSDTYATRRQGPVLQQLEHPSQGDVSVNDCFRPVSRYFDRILRPEHLLTALPEAMRVLTSPVEAGTVTIALPQDVQSHAFDFPSQFFEPRTWRIPRPQPEPDMISAALDLLRAAERPLIIAGGGVHYSEAAEALSQFAYEFGIPVAETFAGKGAMQKSGHLTLGGIGLEGSGTANEVASASDLVICVGTRLTDFTTASRSLFQNPEVRFVSINVDERDSYKQGALAVIGDARAAIQQLGDAARAAGIAPRAGYLDEVTNAKSQWDQIISEACEPVPGEKMSSAQLIRTLNEFVSAGDTVVAAAGGPPGDLLKMWDASGQKNCHLEFGFSCMGYEIPGGIGVRFAQPEGEVYVYIGDGTYLMNPTELVTAAQEGLKVTVVIAENHGFQVIRRLQMARTGRSFGNEFRRREPSAHQLEDKVNARLEGEFLPLDLAATARGFGAAAFEASTPDELRSCLEKARQHDGPSVIVAEIEPHRFLPPNNAWFDVAPAEVSNDSAVQSLREEYERDRTFQRHF